MTEFKCGACGLRKQFPHRMEASQAGWLLSEVVFAGVLRYFVRCPQHVPEWAKEVINGRDGKRSTAGAGAAAARKV